jgi:hypothetical protein
MYYYYRNPGPVDDSRLFFGWGWPLLGGFVGGLIGGGLGSALARPRPFYPYPYGYGAPFYGYGAPYW